MIGRLSTWIVATSAASLGVTSMISVGTTALYARSIEPDA
jgi:hypothetical protein